ncbi:MAG: porin [Holosporaceae bacterium]|jgi:predicted porin|nr:porin [Holosporaceae bacterium]
MNISKHALFLSLFLFANLSGTTGNSIQAETCEDDFSLNNLISDELEKLGVEAKLTLGIVQHFTTLFISQDENGGKGDAVASLQGDVNFRYLDRCDGYGYGFEIGAITNSGIIKQGNPIVKTSFVFLESDKIGTVKAGYANTAADSFCICGDKFLVGYGGAGSGNLGVFYNRSAGSRVDTGFFADDSRAAKIVWLSPIISGLSAGLSFTPDSRNAGLFKTNRNDYCSLHEKTDFSGMCLSYSKNVITGGMAYEFGDPDDLNIKISVAAWRGKGKSGADDNIEVHNIGAYNVGATICHKNFKASCGYTNNGKSLLVKKYATNDGAVFDESIDYQLADPGVGLISGANAGKIYSLGIAYSFDKLEVSAGYFKSIVKFSANEKAKADIISVAAEYKFNGNLSAYVEYDNIATNTCDRARIYEKACHMSTTGRNRANVFMIGSKISL